jgi:hypothetical protein
MYLYLYNKYGSCGLSIEIDFLGWQNNLYVVLEPFNSSFWCKPLLPFVWTGPNVITTDEPNVVWEWNYTITVTNAEF